MSGSTPEQMLSVSLLRPSPHNRPIDTTHVADLAESMQASGQWHSIRARLVDGGMYEIVAGHHRVEAAMFLGWPEIRAQIVHLTDEEADAEILDSNMRHKALTADEEARAIHRMITVHGWKQHQVAQRFNRSQKWVSERLALVTELVPAVQELIPQGIIQPSHAVQIARAPKEDQPALARKVADSDLSKAETEALVRVVAAPDTPADVRQAVLEQPKMTPAHAEAIAKVSNPGTRRALINDVANGLLTPEETEREVRAVTRQAEAPKSIFGKQIERRHQVFPALNKVEETLQGLDSEVVYDLERDALQTAQEQLRRIAAELNRLGQVVATGLDKPSQKPKDGKLVPLRGA